MSIDELRRDTRPVIAAFLEGQLFLVVDRREDYRPEETRLRPEIIEGLRFAALVDYIRDQLYLRGSGMSEADE